jgi:hypothetical protein
MARAGVEEGHRLLETAAPDRAGSPIGGRGGSRYASSDQYRIGGLCGGGGHTVTAVRDLLARWAADIDRLRDLGASATAKTVDRCATELEEALRLEELREISASEAVELSGFDESSLRAMRRRGELTDVGHGRYLANELPRKPKRTNGPRPAGDLADEILLDRARSRMDR